MHELFRKRKSTRSFAPREIEREKLDEILEAANSAPSAGNLKARKIIEVSDTEMKKEISKAAFGQESLVEAPVVLIFVALPKVSAQKYDKRGEVLYAVQDATLAGGFAWLQAVALGLAGCWVGGFDEESVKETLKLGADERPIAMLPVGYA